MNLIPKNPIEAVKWDGTNYNEVKAFILSKINTHIYPANESGVIGWSLTENDQWLFLNEYVVERSPSGTGLTTLSAEEVQKLYTIV